MSREAVEQAIAEALADRAGDYEPSYERTAAHVLDAALAAGCLLPETLEERLGELTAALAVQRAKVAMFMGWLRSNVPDCPLLPENIVRGAPDA